MKRPCFALTMLLGSLAGSLAAVGTAHSQSVLEPAPSGSGYEHACPFAPGESSGSVGLCEDEDTRWQAHQIEERFDYLRNYDEESLDDQSRREPTPAEAPVPAYEEETPAPVYEAEIPAPVYEEETPAPVYEAETPAPVYEEETPAAVESTPAPATEIVPDYGYRSGYDGDYDYEVYRDETTETLDPYWTENKLPADVAGDYDYYSTENYNTTDDVLDPYWTENKLPAEVTYDEFGYAIENDNTTNDVLDPYWTENKLPAELEVEVDPYWTNNNNEIASEQPESTTIDQDWARDSIESIESWIEKLNSDRKLEGTITESTEPAIESQSEEVVNENSLPAVEEKSTEQPTRDADPTYGAHLWDDCELGHKGLRNCDRPQPEVTNYGVEPTFERNESFNVIEHRDLLLSVARTLNEAGVALQTASQNLSRIATEEIQSESSNVEGIQSFDESYND